MRIVNYENDIDFDDIGTLTITIKAVPFEGGYVPAFVIVSPEDDYTIKIDEVHCLMDGIEIAQSKVDDIINFILMSKVFNQGEDEEEDDIRPSD
jgi:hypothetical protein